MRNPVVSVDGKANSLVWFLVSFLVCCVLIRAVDSPLIFSDIKLRSARCSRAWQQASRRACIEKENVNHHVELTAQLFWWCMGFVAILVGSILPKEPPHAEERARASSYFVRGEWQYGEGPRGGEMRRKVDYEITPMERQKYVMLPAAPWIRWPFAAYPYFVPEQNAQGRDVWTRFEEKEEHPLSDWRRTPRPARVY